jgi:hypothetical protein
MSGVSAARPSASEHTGSAAFAAAFTRLCTDHGDELRALAASMLGAGAIVELVVVGVISGCCAAVVPSGGRLPSRRELLRLTYLRCLDAGATPRRITTRPATAAGPGVSDLLSLLDEERDRTAARR